LHEGLAQTLSAIKLALEISADRSGIDTRLGKEALVPLLQRTIGEVEALATELRPSSLDDLGLRPAISALCIEIGRRHPDLEIQMQLMAAEDQISSPLKIVIYRSLETALRGIARSSQAITVRVGLRVEGDAIALVIDHDGNTVADLDADIEVNSEFPISTLRERVILSGGELSVRGNGSGETTLRAQWPR
jgi:signal transduction histidine kinase